MQRLKIHRVPYLKAVNGKVCVVSYGAVVDITGKVEVYGGVAYCVNGVLHRDNAPAFYDDRGHKWWYSNGQPHRKDGPAVEYADGRNEWRLNGREYTEDEFNEKIKKTN